MNDVSKQSFTYVGKDETECKEILHTLTNNTSLMSVNVERLQFYSLERICKGKYRFKVFYPGDVYDMGIEDLYKYFNEKENNIAIDSKKIENVFQHDDIKNLNEGRLMFCITKNDAPFYMIPSPEFLATFQKVIGLKGNGFKYPTLIRNIFLGSVLYETKTDIIMIMRKITKYYCRLYACATEKYQQFSQEDVFLAIKAAQNTCGNIEFDSYRITEKISKVSFLFSNKTEDIFQAGVQITMSDIGDSSTTIAGYIKIGETRIYTKKIQHSHRKKLTLYGYDEGKRRVIHVDGMQQYIETIATDLDATLLMLKKTKRKKVDDPIALYNKIEKKVPIKKALGERLYESARVIITQSFSSSKRQYYLQDVVIALARLALVKGEVTFSTLEALRETLGQALPLIEKEL